MDRLEYMLAQQLELQKRLGHDYESMTIDERIAYIKEMWIAAVHELVEALNETTWKSWASGDHTIQTSAFLSELTDTWQFIANMWFAATRATPTEIANEMQLYLDKKLHVNHARITQGYDGTNKCPKCRRALDDPAVSCLPHLSYCASDA